MVRNKQARWAARCSGTSKPILSPTKNRVRQKFYRNSLIIFQKSWIFTLKRRFSSPLCSYSSNFHRISSILMLLFNLFLLFSLTFGKSSELFTVRHHLQSDIRDVHGRPLPNAPGDTRRDSTFNPARLYLPPMASPSIENPGRKPLFPPLPDLFFSNFKPR